MCACSTHCTAALRLTVLYLYTELSFSVMFFFIRRFSNEEKTRKKALLQVARRVWGLELFVLCFFFGVFGPFNLFTILLTVTAAKFWESGFASLYFCVLVGCF